MPCLIIRNSVSSLGLPQVTYQCHDGKAIQERSVLDKTDLAVIQTHELCLGQVSSEISGRLVLTTVTN